jgi:hypothetical protein
MLDQSKVHLYEHRSIVPLDYPKSRTKDCDVCGTQPHHPQQQTTNQQVQLSTLVAVLANEQHAMWVHVGDE